MIDSHIISRLREHDVEIDLNHQLTLGDKCKTVFTGHNLHTGESLVVKIGLDEVGRKEVTQNIEGYEEIRAMGAESLLPKTIFNFNTDEAYVLVMSHCGEDFWHATKSVAHPEILYSNLVKYMHPVYAATLRFAASPIAAILSLQSLLLKIYGNKVARYTHPKVVLCIENLQVLELSTKLQCFSSYDFTPEDVFVTDSCVKYADPKFGQVGVPVLDLSCFAGVARDAHHLPGSREGYEILHDYAVGDLAGLLELEEEQAETFFELGRAVQCGLSGFFRLSSDPEVAEAMIASGAEKILHVCT